MAHTDISLDAMLGHLGAAYYESLYGRRVRDDVRNRINEVKSRPAPSQS